jgi:hypothetical protein
MSFQPVFSAPQYPHALHVFSVFEVGVRLDPGGGLGLDGLGEHPPRPIPEDLGEDVLAGGQPHDVFPGGRLVHSGVLPGRVGQLV